jgi:hypothetical protein
LQREVLNAGFCEIHALADIKKEGREPVTVRVQIFYDVGCGNYQAEYSEFGSFR